MLGCGPLLAEQAPQHGVYQVMAKLLKEEAQLSELVSLCKRRGFIFPSSEIYGGYSASWDYGPLGVELKNNVKQIWWEDVVTAREDVVGMDCAIIMHPRIWEASGHVEGFHDPLVDCKACKGRFRADHLDQTPCPRKPSLMVGQHSECELTEPRQFNLMFKTQVGPVEDTANIAYLRPETAQAIFVNFLNVQSACRMRVPFGIAQIGKSFRNEIVTRYFTFRSREFEQMELEFFCAPADGDRWFEYWYNERLAWYKKLGIRESKLRLRAHRPDELAHYARGCFDVEYEFPFGWSELEGIANRTDFDLSQHTKFSGKDMSYRDPVTNDKYIPHCIESSAGVDRTVLTLLCDAYTEDEVEGERRVVLRFHPRVAPITVAVFPLMKKEELTEVARRLERDLRERGRLRTFYDEAGNIGRRYRRQDEVGTPFCVTVDPEGLADQTVTIRDRDTLAQQRVPMDRLGEIIWERVRA